MAPNERSPVPSNMFGIVAGNGNHRAGLFPLCCWFVFVAFVFLPFYLSIYKLMYLSLFQGLVSSMLLLEFGLIVQIISVKLYNRRAI
jgi:hypothetical protein